MNAGSSSSSWPLLSSGEVRSVNAALPFGELGDADDDDDDDDDISTSVKYADIGGKYSLWERSSCLTGSSSGISLCILVI